MAYDVGLNKYLKHPASMYPPTPPLLPVLEIKLVSQKTGYKEEGQLTLSIIPPQQRITSDRWII
jgi:hypothetical protein